VRKLLEATADPDGHGLLLRGREFAPCTFGSSEARPSDPDLARPARVMSSEGGVAGASLLAEPGVTSSLAADPSLMRLIEPLLRLARLADATGTRLIDHPDPCVRRSAAIVAARAYPLLLGLDG
jgi:hypothetical protein